jgi:tetratricopeptide (TPR) repeat protein
MCTSSTLQNHISEKGTRLQLVLRTCARILLTFKEFYPIFHHRQTAGGFVKTILATFLIIFLLLPVSAVGEIQTVAHTVKQTFGGSQSPDDARIAAVAKAKREVLEMAGTYIESLTVVKNSQVEQDEILALAAGVLKAEVVSQKNYASEDAFGIEIIVNVVVDTSVLEERVQKLLENRTHLTQIKDTQKREKKLLQKVAQLEEENRKLMVKKQSTQKLKKEFQQTSQRLKALEWLLMAVALWDGEKHTDPKKAIEYLNNAIKLQPDDADAYITRGLNYEALGQRQRAIEDYSKAIHLKRDCAYAYIFRGSAYHNLAQYQLAIEDFNKVIRMKPDDADAYNKLGRAYDKLKRYDDAIEAYRQVLRINPKDAEAWYFIGLAYSKLSRYD